MWLVVLAVGQVAEGVSSSCWTSTRGCRAQVSRPFIERCFILLVQASCRASGGDGGGVLYAVWLILPVQKGRMGLILLAGHLAALRVRSNSCTCHV
jgi:hypothetical protein